MESLIDRADHAKTEAREAHPACANCSRPLASRACAPHKRFCSDACRMQWHGRRRAEALRLWEAQTEERNQALGLDSP